MRLLRQNPTRRDLPLGIVLVLLTLAWAALPAQAIGSRSGRSCAPPGATVDAKSGQARIFHTKDDNVFVCRPGVRRKIGLRFNAEEQLGGCNLTVSRLTLTPRYAAWTSDGNCGDGDPNWTVSVLRISSKTRTETYPSGPGCQTNCPGGRFKKAVGPVQRIALTSRGALAWSAQDQFERRFFEISKVAEGQPVQLARGTDVDPKSVRWAGSLVTWKQDGTKRSG